MIKRGQVTIFIILGVVIVGGVALAVLLLSGKIKSPINSGTENMNQFLETCVQKDVLQNVATLSASGGSINDPLSTPFRFTNGGPLLNVSYLCYNGGYQNCSMTHLLYPYFEQNLKQQINSTVKDCYDSLVKNLQGKGYKVESSYNDFTLKIEPNWIAINISADMTTTKSTTERYQNFGIQVPSGIYDMLNVVQSINNLESICAFDHYALLNYPDYNISEYGEQAGSTVFNIVNKKTKDSFNFAVRSCVIGPLQ